MDLILGHNQFIGISHTSEEKGMDLQKKFFNPSDIYNVVEMAADLGYKNIIIENHPKMLGFLDYYLQHRTFDMSFYLQVPNIQGYIHKMNEMGFSRLFLELAQRDGIKALSSMALKNVMNLAKKNYSSLAMSALQLEVAPFMDVEIKALLLHNVSTDLLLSLQMQNAFIEYIEYVREDLKLNPGFITLNFRLFKESFNKWGLQEPLVMTPINPRGFDMNPSKKSVEDAIEAYKGDIIAMNIMGGGAFSLKEVFGYLCRLEFNSIKFCAVGASTRGHLEELVNIFKLIRK